MEHEKKQTVPSVIVGKVSITYPDKDFFPGAGITKGEVARYYLTVSKRMMPYIENRVLSIVRCPGGIDKACFYRKHPAGDKGAVTIPIVERSGRTADYFYVTDVHGLVTEVQMDTLEFHIWGSRVDHLEKPDMLVFDLDPDIGMDVDKVRQGVRDLKSILDGFSLVSYLKTSGGKGYHIVVPLRPAADWNVLHAFAGTIAKTMAERWPERYIDNARKAQRNNRVFIDWLRNGRGATTVAPYSIRAREGGPVSMPITWKELDSVAPRDVTMTDAIERLGREDPWESFFENDQRIP